MLQSNTGINAESLYKVFIFNPCYIMRSDINRIILTTSGSKEFDKIGQDNVSTFIHPIHAMMFSFFKGNKNLKEILDQLAYFYEISLETAYNLISKFIENEQRVVVEYDKFFFYFPPKILIEYKKCYPIRTYSVDDFNLKGDLNFTTYRFNIPIETSILINNRCITDCVYCYADKRQIHNCTIPFERLQEIIEETKKLGFRNFDIQGGELFLYEHWYELLNELLKASYSVYISTKYPLSSKQINQLKELGIKEIQISLDSIFTEDLQANLGVSENYRDNILISIKQLNDNGFSIKMKAVITSQIYNLERIEKYIDYFKQFDNIKKVEITAPSHSRFKTQTDFFSYRLTLGNIREIKNLVMRKNNQCHFELSADVAVEDSSTHNLQFDDKKEKFSKRARCTGNQSSFLILPNGDVTLCEEAYFNKNLIIGNILKNSIMDVWNSKRATNLFYIKQTKFPMVSPCSRCTEFEECRYNLGVCWVDAMAAYGEENWLHPVPDCPYSPPVKYVTYCQ